MSGQSAIQVGWKGEEWLAKKLRWLNFQEYLVGDFKNIGGLRPRKLSLSLSMSTLLKTLSTFRV